MSEPLYQVLFVGGEQLRKLTTEETLKQMETDEWIYVVPDGFNDERKLT